MGNACFPGICSQFQFEIASVALQPALCSPDFFDTLVQQCQPSMPIGIFWAQVLLSHHYVCCLTTLIVLEGFFVFGPFVQRSFCSFYIEDVVRLLLAADAFNIPG